jgi:DNA-directed RNA polymerase subunit L
MEDVKMPDANMPGLRSLKMSNDGRDLTAELMNFPVGFVNALRRILLSGIPTVVIRDVTIFDNTTQMPHEMLRHRMEMLPVNVTPDESHIIKDAKIELRIPVAAENKTVTTDDFTVESGREGILMKDPEFGKPCLFLRLRKGETVHITGRLTVLYDGVSQVETATTAWHIDPEMAKNQRKQYVSDNQDDKDAGRYFDNFLIQRSYSRDARGRPNWFDLQIKSVGVIKARELLNMAVGILRKRITEYVTEALKNITHEKDAGTYHVSLPIGGHTVGVLMQEVIYQDDVESVSYDIPHPLKDEMVLRFNTKHTPEKILENAKKTIEEYCSLIENNDGGQ